MKRIIFIGASLLVLTTTAIVANNKLSNCNNKECGQEICCKPGSCPLSNGCESSCCK